MQSVFRNTIFNKKINSNNLNGSKKILLLFIFYLVFVCNSNSQVFNFSKQKSADLAQIFLHPPESAKPGVLWMWTGSNISKEGITKDLEALKKQGFGRATMYTPADIVVPWAAQINNSPTPEVIAWTEPWWKLVRHAAEESKRLGIDFGMHNCPGYETSGGVWITPELSMQELCWSKTEVNESTGEIITLAKPIVNPFSTAPFQEIVNPETGKVEKPLIEARKNYYADVAVLAVPVKEVVPSNEVIHLTDKMQADGKLNWKAPSGKWIIYRFGTTTTGTLISPAQFKAAGLECDKMSQQAVDFHMDYIIREIKKHLGDLIGSGFTHVHFDSYEAGTPTWTPKMREEFLKRRGYDIISMLPVFAGQHIIGKRDSLEFINDFNATVKDLYGDIYFKTVAEKLKAAKLIFLCEPYGGPWRRDDVVPYVGTVMTEFWTNKGEYSPSELDATVEAARKVNKNIITAEAFTGMPEESMWSETPAWLKPIGDAAFCAGVNRLMLHRFTHQPWDDKYKPGAAMGQWGTHFDRTQTWWKPGRAMIEYWHRCQALLQWGSIAHGGKDDFIAITNDSLNIKFIHRGEGNTNIYFVANTSRNKGMVNCSFDINGKQPELWDAVTGEMKLLTQFENVNRKTILSIQFDEAQSFFVVFRNKIIKQTKTDAVAKSNVVRIIDGAWQVKFDEAWGGPAKPVVFNTLQDWTNNAEPGIKYFSGTAIYKKTFDVSAKSLSHNKNIFYLELGIVKHIARVTLNGKDIGVVWTAPWKIKIPTGLLKNKNNQLQIEVTNVWANRLIGDEQEPQDCEWLPGHMGDVIKGYNSGHFLKEFPNWFLKKQPRLSKGRYCFTTWNYFNKNSPLVPSGLLGPVRIVKEN